MPARGVDFSSGWDSYARQQVQVVSGAETSRLTDLRRCGCEQEAAAVPFCGIALRLDSRHVITQAVLVNRRRARCAGIGEDPV